MDNKEYEKLKSDLKNTPEYYHVIIQGLKERIQELEYEVRLYKPYKAKYEELEAAATDLEEEIENNTTTISALKAVLKEVL